MIVELETWRRLTGSRFLSRGTVAVAGITGILVPFMPFAPGISLVEAMVTYHLWPFALPSFLSIPILGTYLMWQARGRIFRAVSAVLYAFAIATTVLIIHNIISIENEEQISSFAALGALVPFAAGVPLLISNLRGGKPHVLHPVVSLQICYIAHMLFLMMVFIYPGSGDFSHFSFSHWGISAHLSVATIVLYSGQVWGSMRNS